MDIRKEKSAEKLFANQVISQDELIGVKAYRSLGLFSLHNELLSALYVAVLLISGGLGILIYQNIDTIGHTILIALVFVAAVACFYSSLKKARVFSRQETFFQSPIFDYVVLLGTLLTGTFFGYLQYQYSPLGNDFALAALFTSLVAFAAAYRFDNRSSLSVAITAMATIVGITMTPKAVMALDVFEHLPMFYIGILLGIMLAVWGEFSERRDLKKHFAPMFYGFAQHLVGICCLVGLCQDFWPIFLLVLVGAVFYFYRKSYQTESVATFVFTILYAYIGFNIGLIRLLILLDLEGLFMLSIYLAPFFYGGSIVLFILQIRKFNKDTK